MRTRPVRQPDLADLDRRWREANREFEENDHHGPAAGPPWLVRRRRSPLVLTAVHGVRHRRPGQDGKANDANTGGLCVVLGAAVPASTAAIVRSSDTIDANTDPTHPFKADVAERLRVGPGHIVVDIHGMSDDHGVDLAFGPGPRPTPASWDLIDRLYRVATDAGLRVDRDGSSTGLQGAGAGTMTSWAQGLGAAAIQIEIARSWRSFRSPTSHRHRLLAALVGGLRSVTR